MLLAVRVCAADDGQLEKGKAIYAKQCASCHGDSGQGVKDHYEEPLTGEKTVDELSKLIAETMPEDDPEACVGENAAAVAGYIHQSFYGKSAQPQIRLARLTGSQLRQSLSDVYAHFGGVPRYSDERGLSGRYSEGGRRQGGGGSKRIDRVDPVVDFDFEDKGPGEEINPEEFTIEWTGGVKIDESGEYEFVLRSTCSFVCYLGTYDKEFINNHVQSGDKTEFHRTISLTAGRVYPFKLRFQQRKRKTEQPPAKLSLSWVPPHGVEQIIPARHLIPDNVPPAFALQTKLPPDDRSYGYERGIAVDRQWDDSTTTAAIEFADIAALELWPRYQQDHRRDPNENRARLRNFLAVVAETAFRRPLDDMLDKIYVDAHVDASDDDGEAIKRSLLMTLKSPRFLYPLVDFDQSPSQRAANRLALTLYDSLPADDWIIREIDEGKLQSEAELRAAARRMANDYRLRGKTREMLYAWLNLSHIGEINKKADAFPGFDAELVSDLRRSLDTFLDDIVWSEQSDFRELIHADWTYTNDRLHEYYGPAWQPAEEGSGLRKTIPAGEQHHGVLSHPLLMSGLAYPDSTSPIHRGVFVIRNMLGRTLRPPQEAFTPLSPDLHPDLTTRERIALQTSPKNCQVCHVKINALGFPLEHFDAVGRYRIKENEKPIDARGDYTTLGGSEVKIDGAGDLSSFLVESEDAHRAFVERAFEHFVKQPAAGYGADTLEKLTKRFQENEFNIRELLIDIAVIAAQPPGE